MMVFEKRNPERTQNGFDWYLSDAEIYRLMGGLENSELEDAKVTVFDKQDTTYYPTEFYAVTNVYGEMSPADQVTWIEYRGKIFTFTIDHE